jgi:adenylate cyclase
MSNSEGRQLAAIMFTDIVGYSTLMHKNENLGFELLHEHRAIVRDLLEKFRGLEIDTAGDGFVVKFTSVVDAVRCGVEIQNAFSARNQECPPERSIVLRIGIHVSDVLESRSNSRYGVYGDGVNIAARLQPLAPRGGICISSAVYENVRGRVDCPIAYMGTPKLKGIARPIKLYVIEVKPATFMSRIQRQSQIYKSKKFIVRAAFSTLMAILLTLTVLNQMHSPDKANSRIAVLPFDTAGLVAGDEFIPEGLVSDLISSLSKDGVRVMAKDSVAALAKAHKSPHEIGTELAVDRMIVGGFTKVGGKYKVSMSLIDTVSQEVVWTEDFESSERDVLGLKNAITSSLSSRILPSRSLASVPSTDFAGPSSEKKDAYIAYLRGQFQLSRRTKEGFRLATVEFEKSIQLDPAFAPAYAELAIASSLESWYGVKPPVEGAIKILKNANRALTLDPRLTEALLILAEEKIYLENDFVQAEDLYRKALASNPRHAMTHQWYAEFLAYSGRFRESFQEVDKALELDPLNPVIVSARGVMHYFAKEYDVAIESLEKSIDLDPNLMLNHYWLGRALLKQKKYPAAILSLTKAVDLSGREPMALAALAFAYSVSGETNKALALQKEINATMSTRYVSPYFLAKVEVGLGHPNEALKLLQRSVIEHGNQTVAAFVDPEFEGLRENPEFAKSLASINPPKGAY